MVSNLWGNKDPILLTYTHANSMSNFQTCHGIRYPSIENAIERALGLLQIFKYHKESRPSLAHH